MPHELQIDRVLDARRPISLKRRLLFFSLYAIYVIGLIWIGSKLVWLARFGVATPEERQIWVHYYPDLERTGALDARLGPHDGYLDVLLLGASTLEQARPAIEERLHATFGERVRIYDLAKSAHTSRDSYLKYKQLENNSFDLIVIYDGINDARMNCCTALQFRDDYSHCTWYRAMYKRIEAGRLTLPDLVLDQSKRFINLGEPDLDLRDEGLQIKTADSFRQNLEYIVSDAAKKRTPVVLMTFAYHIPPDYTKERFRRGELDYAAPRGMDVETWGHSKAVVDAIDAHNAVIQDLAHRPEYDNVVFVDQLALLPRTGECFTDPCHLTAEGHRKFAENLDQALAKDAALLERLHRATTP